ncbi:succinate--CoA ligase subunit beta [Planktothrix sp. FACHB-1355]|uniref:Succinate--CoA ligase subunit beta n=1 Tax=Aerosakkonema funiforme FACHB-1375 TaxID=2949571 RepID=A0A926VCJ6_9CYAN|nr:MULTISPECIES: succinate--CoA ligase subunit beta [Oscillatoriales]MBD2181080.1 succinate--CoA ligase subunit beta [Aerosakkonema funiforme FACHB-1375]MBD3562837.1 succinate--CoA ligase subunit beta [Planktothrix sp. FACHB-1355]
MDLLEYQAKELFREIGIPVLPSQRIDSPRDLKGLKIPYPVVLKSQVPAGGRGRAGGIKFVENTIDAIAAAQTIFHLPIMGQYPEVLLAEARYDAEREFYLAVALDYTLRRPVLLGSPKGGIDVEAVMEQMQQVVIEQEFSPFYARRLALKMGLEGNLIQSVSDILQAMYNLFVQKDLDLVEINPLGVNANGEVMALDGKVTANDCALQRHPDLAILATKVRRGKPHLCGHCGETPAPVSEDLWELEGNIGIVCNGTGLAMATLDSVYQAGGKPASCLNVGEEVPSNVATTLCDRLEKGLETIAHENSIKVLLVNILGGVTSCDELADAISNFVQRNYGEGLVSPLPSRPVRRPRQDSTETGNGHNPYFVVRLAGSEIDAAKERLGALGVSVIDNLDEAVSQAVALTKPSGKRS